MINRIDQMNKMGAGAKVEPERSPNPVNHVNPVSSPVLRDQPGSITPPQLRRIWTIARRAGQPADAVHAAAGVESLKMLSARSASELIARLGGGELDHPPGQAPKPKRRPKAPGVIRLVTDAQLAQASRLLLEAFGNDEVYGYDWLKKHWKVAQVRELTRERCGQLIRVLKEMKTRPVAGV